MTIEERLEKMERELGRQKRRNRWLLGAILVVVGGLIAPVFLKTTLLQAQAQVAGAVKELRVNKISLVDETGKTRAALGVFNNGPYLTLYGENGKPRAGLNVGKDGPHLDLYDENEKIRFMAGKTATTTPEGKTITYPESSLVLFGPDGTAIWSAIK